MTVTTDEIVALTGSALSTDTISSLISIAQNEVESFLVLNDVTIYDSDIFDVVVRKLTLALVIERQKLDGTLPSSLSIGGISVSHDPDGAIRRLREEAMEIMKRMFVKGRTYRTTIRKVEGC